MVNQGKFVKDSGFNQDQVMSPSVSRAVQIIEYLSQGASTLAQLSKALKIPKSTLHGILSTLQAHDWIEIEGRKIRQGERLFQVVIQYSHNELLKPLFRDVARGIVAATGETCFLGILEKDQILHIARVDGTAPLRYVAEEGEQSAAYASALGKVLLAEYDASGVKMILGKEELPALTKCSVRSLDQLLDQLSLIRQQGYALDQGEVIDGLYCVAAPIRDASKQPIASLALAAPEFRFLERESEYIQLLCKAAADISTRLGYRDNFHRF